MNIDLKDVLKSKAINKWGLFWLISTPMSIVIAIAMMSTDMSTGEGVQHMIGYSVRFAVPFIFIVVAASSVQILAPGPFAMWWLRNRKYIGLCFAVAMAWQGSFIFILSTFFRDYYFEEIYLFRDEIEGTVGYLFLAAMVVTSFHFGRKHLSKAQWTLVHKSGLYFLWAYPFSVYWWNLFYYPTLEPFSDPRIIDYVFYWMGFAAFSLRIAAWGKKRQQAAKKKWPQSITPPAPKVAGIALIAFGLAASASGLHWQGPASELLTEPRWSAEFALWLPYWPLEPFLPLIVIGLGTLFVTKFKPQMQAEIGAAELAD
jgi:DMSO/TMAO reductase YedYZ heme-binding membrane subunit